MMKPGNRLAYHLADMPENRLPHRHCLMIIAAASIAAWWLFYWIGTWF